MAQRLALPPIGAEVPPSAGATPTTNRSTWDTRADGTAKGDGFFGALSRPDGRVSSELSMGTTDVTGKELDIPLMVPTLTKPELEYLLSAPLNDWQHPTMKRIADKAIDFARQRVKEGKPVFAGQGEQRLDLFPELTRATLTSGAPTDAAAAPSSLPAIGAEVPQPDTPSPMNFATVNGQRVSVDDSPIDLVKGAASTLNPVPAVESIGKALIPQAVATATGAPDAETYGPQHLVQGLLGAQGAVGQKMVDAYQQGDYVTSARHAISWLLPVIGPAIDKAADEMQQGKPWRGAGEALGLGLGIAAPEAIAKTTLKIPAIAKNPNPAEAAAVDFGQAHGVPVDAGTATGSPFVRGIQKGADSTPIGAAVATRAKQQSGQAMARVGGELADDTFGRAVTPEQAGRGVVEQLESRIEAHAHYADHAYDTLRTAAQDPKFTQTRVVKRIAEPTGVLDAQGKPVMRTRDVTETYQLPVDLRGAKAALKSVYDQLTRQYSVTQQQASAGYKALGNIVNGPSYAPLVQVEADLGAIKSIARGADMPELRTQSQGLAASGVTRLQAAVDRTAQAAGPDIWRALKDGRASTSAKFGTADVLDRIKAEPVQAFRQMTAAKDSGIDLLKTVQRESPSSIAPIARAYLDDALATATMEGGFDRAAKLAADWQKLGPETKRVLFPSPAQVTALDQFFLLAKKLAESPNPSGTALTGTSIASGGLIFTHPATGIPLTIGAGALSKILRSPTAVKLLTEGVRLTVGPGRASQAARASGIASIFNAAREAGITLSAAPGRAGDPRSAASPQAPPAPAP